MNVSTMLKDNENRWSAAIAKHDTATIESMVAPDFVGVNFKGKVQNRRAMLAELKADKDTYTYKGRETGCPHCTAPALQLLWGWPT